MTSVPRHIAIVALRRSGTTAMWRLLRQDDRFICFDEPFSRLHSQLPEDNKKRTRSELIELYNRDPDHFRQTFAPIHRGEETARGLSQEQRAYLEFLVSGGPAVFDTTRCMAKIPDLKEMLPEAVMVHLFRHPAAFVSSHMLPSDRKDLLGLRSRYNHWSFFSRTGRFNGWGMEELTRTPHADQTAALFAEVGVRLAPPSQTVPAFQRLLAIWLGAYRLAETEGVAEFGDRFLSVSFEDFCARPAAHLGALHDMAGASRRDLDYSWLKPAKPGFAISNPAWSRAALDVGFNRDEMARFFPSGAQ